MSIGNVQPLRSLTRRRVARRSVLAVVLSSAVLAACSGDGLVSPSVVATEAAAAPRQLVALKCEASVSSRSVACSLDGGIAGSKTIGFSDFGSGQQVTGVGPLAPASIIIGGQHINVSVLTKDIVVSGGIFSFNTAVANRSPEPIGTTDGTTSDNSLLIFFNSGPTVTSSNGPATSISVANPDGIGNFTGPNQPFFQYGEILQDNDTSAYKNWQIAFGANVQTFAFVVLVSANVRFPNGFITVTPALDSIEDGSTTQLTGTVKDALGNPIVGQTITWSSSSNAIATVNSSGLVTGESPGTATITATSGARTGTATIVVTPGPFINALFNGPEGQAIDVFDPNWSSPGSGSFVIEGQRASPNFPGNFQSHSRSEVPPSPDYYVEAPIYFASLTTDNLIEVTLRGSDDRIYFTYNIAGGYWDLRGFDQFVVDESLGTYNDVPTPGTTRVVRVEAQGTSIRMYINGVLRVSATVTYATAAGQVSIRGFGAGTSVEGQHISYVRAGQLF